jgi:hypothetical protein
MIAFAQPGLRRFGTSGDQLTLIHRMLELRQTQADLLLALAPLHDDYCCFAEACLQVVRDPRAFERWLATAPTLPTVARHDPDERLWAAIGQGTALNWLHDTLRWPHAMIEARLEALRQEGKVVIHADPLQGYLVSRTVAVPQPATPEAVPLGS